MPTFGPIEKEPQGVRPPYEVPDTGTNNPWFKAQNTGQGRESRRGAALAALLEPLTGVPVSGYERRVLGWLAGVGTPVVAVVAAVAHRARAADPLASGGHEPSAGEHR